MRAAGLRIVHHLAIAVVGGDQQCTAGFLNRIGNTAEPGIDRLHRLDRGRQDAGVADHVGIGVIEHDQIDLPDAIAATALSVSSGADISGCRS